MRRIVAGLGWVLAAAAWSGGCTSEVDCAGLGCSACGKDIRDAICVDSSQDCTTDSDCATHAASNCQAYADATCTEIPDGICVNDAVTTETVAFGNRRCRAGRCLYEVTRGLCDAKTS